MIRIPSQGSFFGGWRMDSSRRAAPLFILAGLIAALFLSGCQPVEENRSITFSRDGGAVSFQHGADGVYVAGKEGGPPIKVFEPDQDIAAVSTPLWNPKDGRLLFTTARRKDGQKPTGISGSDNPLGQVYSQYPITYTCWLRNDPKDEGPSEPIPLFEA